jgi:hypothetical protein
MIGRNDQTKTGDINMIIPLIPTSEIGGFYSHRQLELCVRSTAGFCWNFSH